MVTSKTDKKRKHPPVWLLLILTFTLITFISVGVAYLINLPRHIIFPDFAGIILGLIFLVFGFFILFSALRTLKLRRAFERELIVILVYML
ncbi:MAG: hypothetical protein H8E34_00920 [Bacteroidetes bacterium]|nr:hypothetical protein [Bacteroidota bacterium]MBL6944055.1 hypothetical protein [Bacteroidales bacterium]